MTERAYTVSELIELRRAVSSLMVVSLNHPYKESERVAQVECLVQTHMLAGHVAADFREELEKAEARWMDNYRAQQELCNSNRSANP